MNATQTVTTLLVGALLSLNNLFPHFKACYHNPESQKYREVPLQRQWRWSTFSPHALESEFTGGIWQAPPEARICAVVDSRVVSKWNWIWGLVGLGSLWMYRERPLLSGQAGQPYAVGGRGPQLVRGAGLVGFNTLVVSGISLVVGLVFQLGDSSLKWFLPWL